VSSSPKAAEHPSSTAPGDECGQVEPGNLPVGILRGVGPARVTLLARIGVQSVADLLLLKPHRIDLFEALTDLQRLPDLIGRLVLLRGKLGPPSFLRRGGKRSLTRTKLSVAGEAVFGMWFNQPWARRRVEELHASGALIEMLGRVVDTKAGPALVSPRLRPCDPLLLPADEREPVYPTTAGLGQELLRSLIRAAYESYGATLKEPLSDELLKHHGLPSLGQALGVLHSLAGEGDLELARRRLALEQALCLQARLLRPTAIDDDPAAPDLQFTPEMRRSIRTQLPHKPTAAQSRAIDEILDDLANGGRMRRLLQGDVGSGKTMVAAATALAVAGSGRQVALLAPTALLAEQHAAELRGLFERAGRRVVLLTASLSGPARRAAEKALGDGSADLVVGTHALLSRRVAFRSLALAIIDEQQRFGVAAKRELLLKGDAVHSLLMTATPIPRTLALALYGELKVSVLDELPPGRGGIATRVLGPSDRKQALALVRRHLEAGERAFWVCPRIAEGSQDGGHGHGAAGASGSESGEDVASAERAFLGLSQGSLGAHGVVLVHGALAPEERAQRLAAFRRGDARLLVGTSVVEVGLDVPEATVIVVESAERMGLAQLHQLRGRVGRGRLPGFCVLLVAKGKEARLGILEQTCDGFRIADEDLRRRGAGELVGQAQAGGGEDWGADWGGDLELLLEARTLLIKDRQLLSLYLERRGPAGEVALV
jgi:ATP-dependent DNA helicase RecG